MGENQQQEVFKCNGDCLNCRKRPNERREQWQYCAAQFTYNSMRMIGDMQDQLKSMQGTVEELKGKIEAIQNSEASVFDPTQTSGITQDAAKNIESNNKAQNGDGAPVDPRYS